MRTASKLQNWIETAPSGKLHVEIIKTDYFTEYFNCSGITNNVEKGSGSEIVIEGVLEVTLKSLPGFPDKLVQKVVKLFEPFVGKLIAPNIKEFYQAIKKREGMK